MAQKQCFGCSDENKDFLRGLFRKLKFTTVKKSSWFMAVHAGSMNTFLKTVRLIKIDLRSMAQKAERIYTFEEKSNLEEKLYQAVKFKTKPETSSI